MSTQVLPSRRKAKGGKPRLGVERMTTIALRMEAKEVARIDDEAERAGVSRSHIIRQAVHLFFDRDINHTDNSKVA